MINIIFSGTDKKLFNTLKFTNTVNAQWQTIEELASTVHDNDNSKFILFYTSPEEFLSANGFNCSDNLDKVEQQWLPKIKLLTQFYLANKEQSVLVDKEQAIENSDELFNLINGRLSIVEPFTLHFEEKDKAPLGQNLLNQSLQLSTIKILNDQYEVQEAFETIVCAADLLIKNYDSSIEQREQYCFKKCQTLADQVRDDLVSKQSLVEVTAENELALLQIQQLQEELEAIFIDNSKLKQEVEKTLLVNTAEINNEPLSELTVENEIALLQIQQLQEELEFYFIKYQSVSSNRFINNATPINIANKRFEKSLTLARLLNV